MGLTDTHTFVVGLLGGLVAGFIYAYSTYSNALTEAFPSITEDQKEMIGLASSLCNLLTWTNGLIIDYTSIGTGCVLGGLLMGGAYALYGAIALKATLALPLRPLTCDARKGGERGFANDRVLHALLHGELRREFHHLRNVYGAGIGSAVG